MRQQIEKNIIMIILSILIIVLTILETNISTSVTVLNYTVSLSSIIVCTVLLFMNLLKSNKHILLALNLSRINNVNLMTLSTYYFYIFTVLIILIYNRDINLIFSLGVVITEVLLLMFNLVARAQSTSHRFNYRLYLLKDALFFLMSVVLFLNNIPFESYSIPVDLILVALYFATNLYMCNLLITSIRDRNKN